MTVSMLPPFAFEAARLLSWHLTHRKARVVDVIERAASCYTDGLAVTTHSRHLPVAGAAVSSYDKERLIRAWL